MSEPNRDSDFHALEQTLSEIRPRLLLAPPRTASTALAISLSSHSQVGPVYIHEPCDLFAHKGAPIHTIRDSILEGKENRDNLVTGVLIKEMTFQIGTGEVFRLFARHVFDTVVVLIRDPVLAIESRIRKVCEDLVAAKHCNESIVGSAIASRDYRELGGLLDESIFPTSFTGWESLDKQIEYFDQAQRSYCVVESSEFRTHPHLILAEICAAWGLGFEKIMLKWDISQRIPRTGNLSEQSHWYTRALSSRTVLPPTEESVHPEKLPRRFREHAHEAQSVYSRLLRSPNRIISQ